MVSGPLSAFGQDGYPGERVGLPRTGRGSLASWGTRALALVLDWALCTGLAVLFFGSWEDRVTSAMTMVLFFAESAVLCVLAGGSAGQLICRIAVVRLGRAPLSLPRSLLRAGMVCLVLPAVIVGTDRRGLHDMAVGTAVVNRR